MSVLQQPADRGHLHQHLGFGFPDPEYALRIPKEVWDTLGLDTPHTVLEFVGRDGEVAIRPRVLVHPDFPWFWEPGQQHAEQEAEEEIARGEIRPPMAGEEFLAHLDALTCDKAGRYV
ncbi:AbrB/MazE/SpoVT family DNA-binding domain-containing protein [Streptomonospora sp. PA3]|uniref:AbrB/MazE/SpoVT family DNA-binding domain-containing protein n=1 Tax=Streptomonospora sp. PA3 TaxID=2607326 RepID=UPI0012DC55F1|nr:AbrB/MazE/SpoVT family DNA-binding domain-containing protein [Streptomonospora sp. PA3]MUL42224.1 AbrB/MazE/SpoVT family DNA-binding domain-containing protein [Streptomonospora sp. PA3]